MAKTADIIKGLEILSLYALEEYAIEAEHDVIYFLAEKNAPCTADLARLKTAGWFFDDNQGCWMVYT